MDDINSRYIPEFFTKMLKAHGLDPVTHNDWVTVAGGFPAFSAHYERPVTDEQSGMLSLDVMLDENSVIQECFAAFGNDDNESIYGALDQFAISMFHPIIAGCCGYFDQEQITKEIWPLRMFSKAEIWAGNIAFRMSFEPIIDTPIAWMGEIKKAFKTAKTKKGFNWIALYCSRLNDDPLIASATLNNNAWDSGLQATTNLDWPKTNGFYGARFFILCKC